MACEWCKFFFACLFFIVVRSWNAEFYFSYGYLCPVSCNGSEPAAVSALVLFSYIFNFSLFLFTQQPHIKNNLKRKKNMTKESGALDLLKRWNNKEAVYVHVVLPCWFPADLLASVMRARCVYYTDCR